MCASHFFEGEKDEYRVHPLCPNAVRVPGRIGVDPFWGETQTWKLSQWRFIKRDEIERKCALYLYILSIPYESSFVKRYHLFFVLLVFHNQLDSDILRKNVFVFYCNRPRYTQKLRFLPRFCWKRFSCHNPLP